MSSMTTLEKVYERVSGMARFHEDRMIPVDDVFFNDLTSVKLGSDTHRLRPIAQQSIAYRLGKEGEGRWLLYSEPLRLKTGKTTLYARAARIGYRESRESKATFAVH